MLDSRFHEESLINNQVSATNFVLNLVDAKPEREDRTGEGGPGDHTVMSLKYSRIQTVSTKPIVPEETHQDVIGSHTPIAPSKKHPVAFRIRERLRTFQQGEASSVAVNENALRVRKEIQQA